MHYKKVKNLIGWNDILVLSQEDISRLIIETCGLAPDPYAYAILLSIYTGMTPNEIAALKWEDIDEDYIYIHREQHVIRDGDMIKFVDYTYPDDRYCGNRRFPILSYYRQLIDDIRSQEYDKEFVFPKDGKFTFVSYMQYLSNFMSELGYDITNNDPFRLALDNYVMIPGGLSEETRAYLLGGDPITHACYYFDQASAPENMDTQSDTDVSVGDNSLQIPLDIFDMPRTHKYDDLFNEINEKDGIDPNNYIQIVCVNGDPNNIIRS